MERALNSPRSSSSASINSLAEYKLLPSSAPAFLRRLVSKLARHGGLKLPDSDFFTRRERVADMLGSLSYKCDKHFRLKPDHSEEAVQNAMHLFDQIISKCGHDRLLSQKTSDLCFIETLAMTCYLIARKMVGSPVGGDLYPCQLIEIANLHKCAYCLAPTADKQKQIRWNYLVDMRQDTPSVENMIKIEGEILQKLNWKVRVPPPVHTRTRHSLPAISCRGMPSHPSLSPLSLNRCTPSSRRTISSS